MKIRNLTSHKITIVKPEAAYTFEPDGVVARAEMVETGRATLSYCGVGFDRVDRVPGAPVDLPEPEHGTFLIVSMLTGQAALRAGRETWDLLVPGDLVRDGEGRIIGCRDFSAV